MTPESTNSAKKTVAYLRDRAHKSRRVLSRMAKRSPALRRVYVRLVGERQKIALRILGARPGASDGRGRVSPENMVWIFCTSRSGSTWLRGMLRELTGGRVWEEPKVGQLFGSFYGAAQEEQLRSTNFILGEPTRGGWIKSVRNFVLDGAWYANPFIRPGEYLIIKEPDGARGAPLIMEALPESRMVLLVRDPRDVAASALDATRKGGWMYESGDEAGWKKRNLSDRKPGRFVRRRAEAYVRQIGNAKRAYDLHKGPKAVVRYEDLTADTLPTMRRVCTGLGIPLAEDELDRIVEQFSWKNVPEEEKGGGKFYRKASPGGWREDLTPRQARIIEEVTAPLLKELYPES